jgi:hypothetical protein
MKSIEEEPYTTAGMIAQAAINAAEKKLKQIAKRTVEDYSYWGIQITLDFFVLSPGLDEVSKKIRVIETHNWNLPEVTNV